jgi:hypothetical protein
MVLLARPVHKAHRVSLELLVPKDQPEKLDLQGRPDLREIREVQVSPALPDRKELRARMA